VSGLDFIVAGQAAIAAQPSKGALDDPTVGQEPEAWREFADDFQAGGATDAKFSKPLLQLAGVSSVGPDEAQPAEPQGLLEQGFGAIAILQAGGVHDHGEDQAQGID